MTLQSGPTLADAKGKRRLRKLLDREQVLTEQIAEMRMKRGLIRWEILQARVQGVVDWLLETVEVGVMGRTMKSQISPNLIFTAETHNKTPPFDKNNSGKILEKAGNCG